MRCARSREILLDRGYKIIIWNETNYDLNKSERVRKAYEAKKWSLVSNYARLDILREYGGIYLDADVEVIRDFDNLLTNDLVMGFMWDCALGTAVIAACPQNEVICNILDLYNRDETALKSPNNDTFTDYFLTKIDGFHLNGERQQIGSSLVLDKYAFEQPTFLRRNNYAVHHFSQSWKNNRSLKQKSKKMIISIFSLWIYRKYVCWHSKKISRYYDTYVESIQGR